MNNELALLEKQEVVKTDRTAVEQFKKICMNIRKDICDNPYIAETMRVLPVGGYRSAIGSFWNAVVDDLRNKIIFRSLSLFNKEMKPSKEVNKYEDFQDCINDQMLIDGAYKIGVIGWEAHKVLKQAKETRHIFDGHPKSSEPGLLKVLSMMDDCIKYVLSQEYPPQIIDIDDYITVMGNVDFDRNEYSISDSISDLPDTYKNELINRLFSAYVNDSCSSILRSNIEFVAPIIWKVLPKDIIIQISRRVDKEIGKGKATSIKYAFTFLDIVGSKKYLTTKAKKCLLGPIIKRLSENLDTFSIENECVSELCKYAGYIPTDLLFDYVNTITQTYVGCIGHSPQYSRIDFYADESAIKIPTMFDKFDDESAYAFIRVIKTNKIIQSRITNGVKLNRLRNLGKIVYRKISENFDESDFLEILLDEKKEQDFFELIYKSK